MRDPGPCPTDEEILALVGGRLSGEVRLAVRAHLQGCAQCCRLVAALDVRSGESASLAAPAPRGTIAVDQRIAGRYRVLRFVAQGGMGAVYAAHDEQLDRTVALKLLLPGGDDATRRQRLLREAQAMARISHPAVVPIFEVGFIDEQTFIAMEYVDGDTLTRWMERVRPSWRALLRLYLQAGEGLLAAHRAGLVHRDFKPDNVLVNREGQPRVVDFGLARLEPRDEPGEGAPATAAPSSLHELLSRAGTIAGTPRFMSPEQLRGGPVDARSDQFSFCVSLYVDLFGQHPFPGETMVAVARSVLEGQPRPPTDDHPAPAGLRAALLRGLSRDPAERFPSMRELLDALSLAAHEEPRQARVTRRRVMLGFALLLLSFVLNARPFHGPPIAMRRLLLFAVLLNGAFLISRVLLRRFVDESEGLVVLARLFGMYLMAILLGRVVGVVVGLASPMYIPFDLLLATIFWGVITERVWPRAWPAVVACALGTLTAALRPDQAQRVLALLPQLILWAALLFEPRRAARAFHGSAPASGAPDRRRPAEQTSALPGR